jgi:hypothetical protein
MIGALGTIAALRPQRSLRAKREVDDPRPAIYACAD